MTAAPAPYWTCRRPPLDGQPALVAVTLAAHGMAARAVLCPGAAVAPSEVVSTWLLDRLADLKPGEIREVEVDRLPNWRDNHHPDDLQSRTYCDDIGYDPT